MVGKLKAHEVLHFLNVIFLQKELAGIRHRFMRHLIAGGTGTLLYMISVAVMVEWMIVDPVVAAVIALIFLAFYTYVINRGWVYSSKLEHHTSLPRFLITAGIAVLINSGVMYFVVDIMKW
jgi:putative flippase GtrA